MAPITQFRVTLRDLVTGRAAYSCGVRADDAEDAARRARARAELAGVRNARTLDAHIVQVGGPAVDQVEHALAQLLGKQTEDAFPLIQGPTLTGRLEAQPCTRSA